MNKLKQGFAVTGKASEAGKKGAASRKALMEKKGESGEPRWKGGFKKGDPITVLRSKLAIQERWRRYYEEKARELETIRSTYDEKELEAKFRSAKDAYESIVDKVRRHEREVSVLQQKLALVSEVERKIHFGPLPSETFENGGMMSSEDADERREGPAVRDRNQ